VKRMRKPSSSIRLALACLEGELVGTVPPPNEEGHGKPQTNWVHSQRSSCTL
jgi:hypothetical protein